MGAGLVFDRLIEVVQKKGAGYMVLVDPDNQPPQVTADLAQKASESEVDAFLIGGSLIMSDRLDESIKAIKSRTQLPTIIFPGSSNHISKYADALLFLSLISGRNPNYLIGEHVKAAPIIKRYGLETIPTGYMLIDGGSYTSVGFMSDTLPIPRNKLDIAMAHALAAQYLGMKFIYLECGSGAQWPVPDEMIRAIREYVEIPIIVGGGIVKPEIAAAKIKAGADFIVTGDIVEKSDSPSLMSEFAAAVHRSRR